MTYYKDFFCKGKALSYMSDDSGLATTTAKEAPANPASIQNVETFRDGPYM